MKRSPLARSAPETVRIGNMEFKIPAGTSKARRREFIAAAEQHVLERGEISLADANRLLRQREKRTARALGAIAKRKPPRRRNKYARRVRDFAFMGYVKRQPCCMTQMEAWRRLRQHPDGDRILGLWRGPLSFLGCRGSIEVHHAGESGTGQKSRDDETIPLCEAHHRGDDVGITRKRGPFAGWPRGAVKAWELAMVEHYRALYAAERAASSDLY